TPFRNSVARRENPKGGNEPYEGNEGEEHSPKSPTAFEFPHRFITMVATLSPSVVERSVFPARNQLPNLRHELGRHQHHALPLDLHAGFVFRSAFLVRLVVVIIDHLLDALFGPTLWKTLLHG